MPLGSSVFLKHGDNVTFGALNSNSWRVDYEPMVVACSGVPGRDKQELKRQVSKLGGHILSEWTKDCTLLVMREINVTAKVVGALVTCRSIVTPSYVSECLEALSVEGGSPPDPKRFLPPVVERAINQDESLFEMKLERKTMLQGKTFVFLSQKQHKRLCSVIELAGGMTLLYSPDTCKPTLLQDQHTCVLQSELTDHTQAPAAVTQEVENILKRKQLRLIGEAELGLAVLTASTSVYCNPSIAKEGVKLVNCMKDSQFINISTQKVLVTDTQAPETSHAITSAGQRGQGKAETVQPKFEIPMQRTLSLSNRKDVKGEGTLMAGSLNSKSIVSETDDSEDPFAESARAKRRAIKRLLSPEVAVASSSKSVEESTAKKRIKVEEPSEEASVPSARGTVIATDAQEAVRPVSAGGETAAHPPVKIKEEPQEIAGGHVDTNGNHRVAVKRDVTEIVTNDAPGDVVEEVGSQSLGGDSESSQSQWRKNKRRRRLLSEEEDNGHDARVVDESSVSEVSVGGEATTLPSLPGFISKKRRPGALVKEEEGFVFEPDLPKQLVVMEIVSLIVSKPAAKNPGKKSRNGHPVKNYKNFKKSSYAGQRILPQIIGGSDLVVHHHMQSQASQDMFLGDSRSSDIDRAEALADELFSVEPRGRRGR
ncbi:nibrin-like [Apostichopus japonicus]|uniref:nibrin-like n=1 Tax=Stichopus japonicus TaxID=307972 RepID=UPI003AB4A895